MMYNPWAGKGGASHVYMYIQLSSTFLDFYCTVSFRLCCLQVSTIILMD